MLTGTMCEVCFIGPYFRCAGFRMLTCLACYFWPLLNIDMGCVIDSVDPLSQVHVGHYLWHRQAVVRRHCSPGKWWSSVAWQVSLLAGSLDYFTVSLHSLNGRQIACHYGCARGLSVTSQNDGNSHWSCEPTIHCNHSNSNLYLDQPIIKGWCQPC